MQTLSSNDIISIWEVGARQTHVERALTILAHALPDSNRDALALMPLGERDRLLLLLRARTFGETMQSYVECPSCRTRLEFGLNVGEMLSGIEAAMTEDVVEIGEARIRIRPIDSRDMIAAGRLTAEQAHDFLMRSCMGGADIIIESDVEESIARRLAALDPLAELLINLDCPDCGHLWQSLFDIASFFWNELSAQARRLLQDVATLARAYGWREADILAMSAPRRAFYLEVLH